MNPTPTPATVPLDSIRLPDGCRKPDPGLVASVSQHGILHPVGLQRNADGSLLPVYGARRIQAARTCGLSSIAAVVYPELPPADRRILYLVENVQRGALSPLEEGDVFVELIGLGIAQAEIARRISRPLSYVAARIAVASLPTQARSFLADLKRYNVSAVALLARLPIRRLMEILERHPETASSVELAHDALRDGPRLDSAPFAADCTDCDKRTPAGSAGAVVCLDGNCYADRLSAYVGRRIADLRTGDFRTAPCVVEKEALDFADETDRDIFKGNRAQPLKDHRIAGDGEDGEPAILLGAGGIVRAVRLIDAPRRRDGRATRYTDPQRAAAVQARAAAVVVADRLDDRLAIGPRPIDDAEFGLLAHSLAEAVEGRDLTPSEAFHALLSLAAPKLSSRLRADSSQSSADDRRVLARRVLALLDPDADPDI